MWRGLILQNVMNSITNTNVGIKNPTKLSTGAFNGANTSMQWNIRNTNVPIVILIGSVQFSIWRLRDSCYLITGKP